MPISSSSTPRTAQMVEANRRLEEIHNLTQDKQKEEQVSKEKVKLERKLGNQWRLNLKLLFGILLLIALVTAIVRALAQGDGLLWLLSIPALPDEVGEIATILEIPEGTVASRLYHARRALKEALEAMGAEYP